MTHRRFLAAAILSGCLSWILGEAVQAADSSPQAYAQDIIAAHGGVELLLHKVYFTETSLTEGQSGPGEQRTLILASQSLWFVGSVGQVPQFAKGEVPADRWMWTLKPLVHPATHLDFLPDLAIDGRLAHGLKVSGSIEPAMQAYFDSATKDLVRIDWKGDRILFSNPVEVSGTRVPAQSLLYRGNEKHGVRTELSEVRRLEELPPALGYVDGDTLFFTGESKASASAQLLRIPKALPRLISANGAMQFEAGRDFIWRAGSRQLTLTPNSRIPFKTTAELHPATNAPNAYRSQRGTDRWMFYGPGRMVHDLQCLASYPSSDPWTLPLPAAASDEQLGELRALLRSKQFAKCVMLGDSISTEADASAVAKAWPYQSGYPSLVVRGLESRWGGKVVLKNLSVGGMDSEWGATQVPSVIAEKPDLLLVAFGMNDASGRRTAADFARITKQIVNPIRAVLPHCTVILVSTMTANREWDYASPELYPQYATALGAMVGPGIAVADVTALWSVVEARKKHFDLTGNGLNHPNDFGHRLYAASILAVIGTNVIAIGGNRE